MSINEATKANLRRKSGFIDEVQRKNGVPLFSWVDINITELCNRKCVFCPRVDENLYPNLNLNSIHITHIIIILEVTIWTSTISTLWYSGIIWT